MSATSKVQQFDSSLKRTIVRDLKNESITIIGDFSCSSLTSFWVIDKFSPDQPYLISITRETAFRRRDYLNELHNTNSFIVIQRTISI